MRRTNRQGLRIHMSDELIMKEIDATIEIATYNTMHRAHWYVGIDVLLKVSPRRYLQEQNMYVILVSRVG